MKNLMLLTILLFFTTLGFGQPLQRDNLMGLHILEVELNSGISMDAFKSFFVSKVIPEYEQHWVGLKGHLLQSVRGQYKDQLALIWVFATEPTRDYYFNEDGTPNERELAAFKKVEAIEAELKEKFGSYTVHYQDDWVVQ